MTRKQITDRLRTVFQNGLITPDNKTRAVDIRDVGPRGLMINVALVNLDLEVKAFLPDSQHVGIQWHRGFFTERDFTFAEHRLLAAVSEQLVNILEQATREN